MGTDEWMGWWESGNMGFGQEKENRYEIATKEGHRVKKEPIRSLTIKYLGRKIVINFGNSDKLVWIKVNLFTAMKILIIT